MVGDVASFDTKSKVRSGWGFDEFMLALFLIMVLVGFEPFRPRDPASIAIQSASNGDFVRQISFLGTFVLIVLRTASATGLSGLLSIPKTLFALLAWVLLSTLWSLTPDATLRRAILLCTVTLPPFLFVQILGPSRMWSVLGRVCAALVVADLTAVALVPAATHLPSDAEQLIVGSWRGLHFHKNDVGPLAALIALYFGFEFIEKKKLGYLIITISSITLLIGSRSKSAIGFTLITVSISYFFVDIFKIYKYKKKININGSDFFTIFYILHFTYFPIFIRDTVRSRFYIRARSNLEGRIYIYNRPPLAGRRIHCILEIRSRIANTTNSYKLGSLCGAFS
jgi:hypothetical protein